MLILRFRWVDCQLDSLGKCLTPTATKAALYSLPKSLDQTYDRILQSIPDEYRQQAQTALQWLAYSARPLHLSELAEAVAVEPECGWDFLDNRLFHRQKMLTICSSLVTVSDGVLTTLPKPLPFKASLPYVPLSKIDPRYSKRADTVPHETFDDCEIKLAHYSVKEYLASERILQGPSSFFATLDAPAQVLITKTCLTYLLLFDKPDSLPRERCYEEFPLLVYAAQYWHNHAQAANEENGIDKLVVNFLDDRESFSLLNSLRIPKAASSDIAYSQLQVEDYLSTSTAGRALGYACEFDLLKSAARLIDGGADVNVLGRLKLFPLWVVADQTHNPTEFVQLLLDAGADVHAQNSFYGTALQAAAYRGHSETVRLLLNAGADVKAQGELDATVLQAAASGGLHGTLSLLLMGGADVNFESIICGTALHAAASQGHDETVRVLLKAGADVNAHTQPYETTAFPLAAIYGCRETVVTLDARADVNVQGRLHTTGLRLAASYGHNKTVRVLLNAGADVNYQGKYDGPILGGAHCGDTETVRLLIDAGADVNAQGGACGNALQGAAYRGQRDTFELLLQHGAVITQAGTFDSPWDAAKFGAKTAFNGWVEKWRAPVVIPLMFCGVSEMSPQLQSWFQSCQVKIEDIVWAHER